MSGQRTPRRRRRSRHWCKSVGLKLGLIPPSTWPGMAMLAPTSFCWPIYLTQTRMGSWMNKRRRKQLRSWRVDLKSSLNFSTRMWSPRIQKTLTFLKCSLRLGIRRLEKSILRGLYPDVRLLMWGSDTTSNKRDWMRRGNWQMHAGRNTKRKLKNSRLSTDLSISQWTTGRMLAKKLFHKYKKRLGR